MPEGAWAFALGDLDACDLSTAFDAANRDYRVTIPRDVVAGYSEELEHYALAIVSLHLGLVVDSPALLREWYARKDRDLPTYLDGVSDIAEVAGEFGSALMLIAFAPILGFCRIFRLARVPCVEFPDNQSGLDVRSSS